MSAIENQQRATRVWRRRMVTVGFGFGALMAGSVAMAVWTTNSEPWASGATAQPTHPTALAKVTEAVWPGDCSDVSLKITNPNPHAVTISGISNTGFRNVSDTTPSEGTKANRLEDFLTQADVTHALDGKRIGAGDTKTFTVPNAVCLSSQADDARQAKTFEAGYAIAYNVEPGTEADSNR